MPGPNYTLTDIPTVGATRKCRLEEAGFTSVEEVATATFESWGINFHYSLRI